MVKMEGANTFDSASLANYLAAIDENDDEIARLKDDCAAECEPYRERIKHTLEAVKDAGINMAAFRAVLSGHRAERRQDKRVEALDVLDRSDYEAMQIALGDFGDTPLGSAALDRVRPSSGEEVLNSL